MKISKKVFSLTGLLLAATLLLAACGEDATNTPAPTSPTAAPSSLATTSGTGTATGTTITDNTVLPAFTGTSEVQIDATIGAEVAKQLGVPTLAVKLFTSDDDTTALGTTVDTALTANGYAFGIPGAVKPLSQDSGTVGLYSKSGSSDILFTAVPIPANTVDVGKSIPGIDAASAQKFADQIKGKKTLLIVMSGPNLLQALVQLGQSSATGTPGAAAGATPTVASATLAGSTTVASTTGAAGADTTAAATTSATGTTASATSAGAVSGADVIAYVGATGITLPDVLQSTLISGLSAAKNATLNGFKSSDAPATVKTGLMNTYSQGGWTDATASFAGASDALSKLGPDAFFIAYTKDNKLSFVLGLSGYTAGLLGVSGADANGTVYIVGSGEK